MNDLLRVCVRLRKDPLIEFRLRLRYLILLGKNRKSKQTRNAPVNALGYLRVMFAVDDIDDTLVRLRKHGAELESLEVVQYQDAYRLCYIRGPEGLLIGLAQELG